MASETLLISLALRQTKVYEVKNARNPKQRHEKEAMDCWVDKTICDEKFCVMTAVQVGGEI